MKRTPRMQKAILQTSIINTVFLVVLLCIFFVFAVPKIIHFQEKKVALAALQDSFSTLKKKGISYGDIKSYHTSLKDKNAHTEQVLRNMDASFYAQKIQNSSSPSFSIHIEKLKEEIKEIKNSDTYKERTKALSHILPIYTGHSSQGLRERDFINKIERTFRAFNLSAKGEIGVGNIQAYSKQETSSDKKQGSSLEESIFYIPLSFDIVGKKKDIFDFIHYFEKVGSIGIDENTITVYSDEKIRNPIVLQASNENANMYQSQIAEISSLEARKYPDSSTFSSVSNTKNLLELMSLNQAKERYEVSVELRFYIAGLPEYSMQEYIAEVISQYKILKKEIQVHLQKAKKDSKKLNSGKQIQGLNSLLSLDTLFVSLDKKFIAFQKQAAKKSEIRSTFDQAQKLEGQMELIRGKLESALEDLK